MAKAQTDTVIRHLRRAVLRKDGAGWTDGQLLASFIDQKEEAAFEALVRRHGSMVFGVCRRVVGNHHDAEDAFQATFLVLARKASSVRPRERVANWLHGVALRTAMKAKTMTTKRRGREKQVTEVPHPETPQQGQWCDLQPLLDQELNGLSENYRLPILLCDLEGKTIKEAAQHLGWPQGTLAGRLARGRKLLAKGLARRGVVLSAGALALVVSQNMASAGVPISLMRFTVKAACMFAVGQTTVAGLVPSKVAVLTEGVLKTMFTTKLKSAMAVMLLMAGAIGIGAGSLGYGTAAGQDNKGGNADTVASERRPDSIMRAGPDAPPEGNRGADRSSKKLRGAESDALAATVNGEAILAEEVYAAAYLSLPDAHKLTDLDRSRRITAVWRTTLDRVIERELIVQAGISALTKVGNFRVLKELQDAAANEFGRQWLATVKKSTGLKDDEELRAFLRAQGMSPEAVQRQWERDVIAEEYLRCRLFGACDAEHARKERGRIISELKQRAVIEYASGR